MRILQIIPNLRKGGAERLVLDICTELSKKPDIDVKLVCLSDQNEYPEYLESIKPIVINSSIKLSLFRRNKFYVEELQKFLNDFRPDLIHTHLFEAEIISRSINYPNAKWFSHCHDNMSQFKNFSWRILFSKKELTSYYEKKVLFGGYKKNGGNYFIAISRDTQEYFRNTSKPFKVTLLANAIDYHKFHNPDPGKRHGGILRLINIGSFVEKKNQAFLIEVATVLKRRNIQYELHLLGDGEKRTELEIHTKNLRLGKEVFFHGKIDRVEEILWESDIYVHSATYEPLGLVLLEAMTAGLPIITLDGKGNRDLIVQGKNGYMLFERDPQKFADKILDVWANKTLYQGMSEFAVKFANGYDIKGYVDKLLEIYRQAL